MFSQLKMDALLMGTKIILFFLKKTVHFSNFQNSNLYFCSLFSCILTTVLILTPTVLYNNHHNIFSACDQI